MAVNAIIQILIITSTSNYIIKFVRLENILPHQTSDFSKVVKSKFFVDKSLLIKEILTYKLLHITCPRKFGKSTNMDMVKRFLEININEKGEPVTNLYKTENYKMFEDNNLNIFQKVHFFKTHFGKYPIIFMDYSDFREITSFSSVLSIYKTILQHTFTKHKYLLNNSTLWGTLCGGKQMFNKYCNGEVTLSTSENITKSFEFLLETLFKHFQKGVYILIDNYDSHIDNLIFKNIQDLNQILTFIHEINERILNDNENIIYGAFLTGVLRLSSELPSLPRSDVQHFKFYQDHVFSNFYGVMSEELDKILIKLLPDITERNKTRQTIDAFYKAYKIATQHTKMYNIWSIVSFLQHRKVESYWCKSQSFEIFKPIVSNEIGKNNMKILIGKKRIWANISDPFSNEEILNINKALINKEVELGSDLVNLLFVVVYHFGFLSPSNIPKTKAIALKIPNQEICNKLKGIMQGFKNS